MCGIAGYYVKNFDGKNMPSPNELEIFTDALLLGIEMRGHDSTGMVSVTDGYSERHLEEGTGLVLEKADIFASKFVHFRSRLVDRPRIVSLHTRFATKGAPENLSNNHPVQYGSVYATHNGHIRNDDELFAEHELGRIGEVDTEIIPALFWKYGLDKAHKALQKLDGGFAVTVLDPARMPDHLILAKGPSSPLEYIETDDALIWASTRGALKDAFRETWGWVPKEKRFDSLAYGKMLYLTPDGVEKLDFEVFRKPYVSTPYYGQGNQYSESWETRSEKSRHRICRCGEPAWWHSGVNYDGSCTKKDNDCKKFELSHPLTLAHERELRASAEAAKRDRRGDASGFVQEELVSIIGGRRTEKVKCVGCNVYVTKADTLEAFGYLICPACGTEDDDIDDDDFDNDQEPTLEDLYGLASGSVLGYESDEIVSEVAKRLSLTPQYVGWLLFEAEDEVMQKNDALVNSYCIISDLYDELLRNDATEAAYLAAAEEV